MNNSNNLVDEDYHSENTHWETIVANDDFITNIQLQGWHYPKPAQAKAIPQILKEKNLLIES